MLSIVWLMFPFFISSILRKVLSDIPVPPSLSSPTEADAYVIPKGHVLLAAPGVAQMDPLIWPDATTWNPMRWLDESGVAASAKEQYSGITSEKIDYGFGQVSKGTESPYQPFGAGRHRWMRTILRFSSQADWSLSRCVGESFAYLQLSTIISYIVQHYTMKLENDAIPEPNYRVRISDRS